MNVVINRWTGDGFELPNCVCWVCDKPATVVNVPDWTGALLARICGSCLEEARKAMADAVLKGCSCGA